MTFFSFVNVVRMKTNCKAVVLEPYLVSYLQKDAIVTGIFSAKFHEPF